MNLLTMSIEATEEIYRDVPPTNMYLNVPNPTPRRDIIRHDQFVSKLFKVGTVNEMLMHAALGICGEAGELADALKKHAIYGKPLDRKNVVEELGDLLFYTRALQNLLSICDQEVLDYNGEKLSKRYVGLTYSDKSAIERADKKDAPNS